MRRIALAIAASALAVAGAATADRALGVTVAPPAESRVGARDDIGISVEALGGRTLHPQAPLFVDLEAPDALGLARQRLERADALRFSAPAASFRVGIRPTASGTHVVQVRARAWVCRRGRCGQAEATRRIGVRVVE